jgi:hypothetical protein
MNKVILENISQIIKEKLAVLKEEEIPMDSEATAQDKKTESIYDAKPGNTLIIDFENVTIKLQRVYDDLFKVIDAAESKQLKNNDYIKVEGNDLLEQGKKFTFKIFREANIKYESNPIKDWRIIKS